MRYLRILALLAASLLPVAAGARGIDPHQYEVQASPSDCVNTFTVKLIVAASNTGRAYGVFEDQEFFLERRGTPKNCSIDLATFSDSSMVGRKTTKCLFRNPFE